MPSTSATPATSATSATSEAAATSSASATSATHDLPLVVDLDGTLVRTDTLIESAVVLVRREPLAIFRLVVWLARGRAALKHEIALRACPDAQRLPYRRELVDYLREARARGRRVVLATAAHRMVAERVAAEIGVFDAVLASDRTTNLKGRTKLDRIHAEVGDQFVYAGDSVADLPIWRAAHAIIVAGAPTALATRLRRTMPIEREFCDARGCASLLRLWLRALRVHQWLKNLLLFVPVLSAFSFFNLQCLQDLAIAFASMNMAASATYVANDLWDLEADRQHPRKRNRAFASGALPIAHGLACIVLLAMTALLLALSVSVPFTAMLVFYVALTTLYSLRIKHRIVADVVVLSTLYTMRVIAGGIVAQTGVSHWLLAFSGFAFLSLALVKRCAELVCARTRGALVAAGRGYRVGDLSVLWPLGVGSSLASIVVFGLFISAPETTSRYASASLLWLVAIGFAYLFARLWIHASRGEMDDDPIVHLIGDRTSLVTLLTMFAITATSYFMSFDIAQLK